jgi:RNA polymerase sigma factor (sigma-70 family)
MPAIPQTITKQTILDTWKPLYNCLQILFTGLDEEILKDIIQESMMDFITSHDDLTTVQNHFSYILKIAIRKTWKHIESKKKQAASHLNLVDQYKNIKDINENRESLDLAIHSIIDAISELGEKESQILIMRYFNKASFQEIAGQIGYSSSEVARNAMSRSLQNLRKIIHRKNKNLDWWLENPYLERFFHEKELL